MTDEQDVACKCRDFEDEVEEVIDRATELLVGPCRDRV
jgi:hypothetical protein